MPDNRVKYNTTSVRTADTQVAFKVTDIEVPDTPALHFSVGDTY